MDTHNLLHTLSSPQFERFDEKQFVHQESANAHRQREFFLSEFSMHVFIASVYTHKHAFNVLFVRMLFLFSFVRMCVCVVACMCVQKWFYMCLCAWLLVVAAVAILMRFEIFTMMVM